MRRNHHDLELGDGPISQRGIDLFAARVHGTNAMPQRTSRPPTDADVASRMNPFDSDDEDDVITVVD